MDLSKFVRPLPKKSFFLQGGGFVRKMQKKIVLKDHCRNMSKKCS